MNSPGPSGRHFDAEGGVDLVLSSGFLAFAAHSGFLKAVETSGLRVRGVCGTSAGALSGSLFAAGYPAEQIARELSAVPPIQLLNFNCAVYEGVFNYERVIERLSQLLPPRFEDLEMDFGVGVIDSNGEHIILDSGPLPEAVAASAAIPFLFKAVQIQGQSFADGGASDRVGVRPWRKRLQRKYGLSTAVASRHPALVHVIARSSPFSGDDSVRNDLSTGTFVVKSPKSGVSLWDLGAYKAQLDASYQRALPVTDMVAAELKRSGSPTGRGRPVPVAGSSDGWS